MLEGISTTFDKNSKCDDLDYIQSLIAAQRAFTCMEAARCQPGGKASAHDAFTHLLQRLQPDTEGLWPEAIRTYLDYPAYNLVPTT